MIFLTDTHSSRWWPSRTALVLMEFTFYVTLELKVLEPQDTNLYTFVLC